VRKIFSVYLFILLLILLPVASLSAGEELPPGCDPDNLTPECAPEINLPIYCDSGVSATFDVSLNDDFDFAFTATFEGNAPGNKLDFYVADGNVSAGNAKEAKVTRMSCVDKQSGSGQVCTGAATLAKLEKLGEKLDFEQSVLTFLLRKKSKDVCIGKFTNNAEQITDNGKTEQVFCGFIPTSEEDAQSFFGYGYFSANGYGTEGDAPFHMTFEGFPAGATVKGCTAKSGSTKYREVLSFKVYEAGATDAEVYGSTLTVTEQDHINSNKQEYSYDLHNQLNGSSDSGLSMAIGIPSLGSVSKVNSSISGNSAKAGTSSSNKSRKKKKKARKRKSRKRKARTKSIQADALVMAVKASGKKSNKNQEIFQWLEFNPLVDVVYIAPNCRGDVPSKSYGLVRCGDDPKSGGGPIGEKGGCINLTNTDTAAEYNGNLCQIPRTKYNEAVVKVGDLPAGEYTVCLNDTALSTSLVVASDSDGTRGEIHITDNPELASQISSIVYYNGDLTSLQSVEISDNGACSTVLMSATL